MSHSISNAVSPSIDGHSMGMAETKMTVKQWLAKTWIPRLYLETRHLYAIGNTPMEDLLSGFPVGDDVNILLLGAGDIRHVLKTVAGLGNRPKHAGKPKTLTFHLNDVDPVIVARDVVLFQIVCDMDPDNDDDLSFLWCVWYNMELSGRHYARLMETLVKLCSRYSRDSHHSYKDPFPWRFGSKLSCETCCQIWESWKTRTFDLDEFRRSRSKNLNNYFQALRMEDQPSSQSYCTSELEVEKAVILQLIIDMKLALECKGKGVLTDLESWIAQGSIRSPLSTGDDMTSIFCINPTLVRPGFKEWCLYYHACPFDAYSTLLGDKQHDESLADSCATLLKTTVREAKEQQQSSKVEMVYWLGDCLDLCCTSILDEQTRMDFIQTSNLADYIGLLPLLLCCAPLLNNKDSVLVTGTMRWVYTHKTMDEYLDLQIGSHYVDLLPTLLGVHLAEDFDFGTNTPPACIHSSAKERTLHWVKACDNKIKLSLQESPQLQAAVSHLVDGCFKKKAQSEKSEGLTGKDYISPLVALTLLDRLVASTDEGKALLVTGTEKLKSRIDRRSADQFSLSHKAMAAALGCTQLPDGTDLDGDKLVCLEVPLNYDFSKVLAVGFSPLAHLILLEEKPLGTTPFVHSFSNYKFNPSNNTVEFLLLKSDWEALPQQSLFYMSVDALNLVQQAYPLNKLATVKHTWEASSVGEQTSSSNPNKYTISSMKETVDSYLLKVDVYNDRAKLDVRYQKAMRDTSNGISLTVSCDKWSTPESIDVEFSCTVDLRKTHIQVSSKQGFIKMEVSKHPLGKTGIYLLPRHKIRLSSLSPATSSKLRPYLYEPKRLLQKMFAGPDMKLRLNSDEATQKSAFYNLREAVHDLWTSFVNLPKLTSYTIQLKDSDVVDMEIFTNGCYFVNDFPLMHITFVDGEVVVPMIKSGQLPHEMLQQERARRVNSSVNPIDGSINVNSPRSDLKQMIIGRPGLKLLRKLLHYNNHLMEQPKADVQPPWMKDSFIQLYFPRYSVPVKELVEEVWEDASRRHLVGEQSSVSAADSSVCAVCGKEGRTLRCSRCKKAKYCSRECQKIQWKEHKKTCRDLSETE